MGLVRKIIYIIEPTGDYAQMAYDQGIAERDYRLSDDPEVELEHWLEDNAEAAYEEEFEQKKRNRKLRRGERRYGCNH